MKKKTLCSICHDVIDTQHVFSEDNQVFLKKNYTPSGTTTLDRDEWYPINFQWISVVKLNENIKSSILISSK